MIPKIGSDSASPSDLYPRIALYFSVYWFLWRLNSQLKVFNAELNFSSKNFKYDSFMKTTTTKHMFLGFILTAKSSGVTGTPCQSPATWIWKNILLIHKDAFCRWAAVRFIWFLYNSIKFILSVSFTDTSLLFTWFGNKSITVNKEIRLAKFYLLGIDRLPCVNQHYTGKLLEIWLKICLILFLVVYDKARGGRCE